MAITLTTLRSQKQTSIHGRRAALDNNDYLVGPKALREQFLELTSASTAQVLAGFGNTLICVTSAVTTATNTWTIPNPTPGARVFYGAGVHGTTSTQGSTAIQLSRASTAFYIFSSEGTTGVAVCLPFGTFVELEGMTTDAYVVNGRTGSMSIVGAT